MPEQIKPIAVIDREAKAAAQKYSDINDACPYPFGSDAAHAFKAAFNAERAALDAQPKPATDQRALCAIKGLVQRGAMCGAVIQATYCGSKSYCRHQIAQQTTEAAA